MLYLIRYGNKLKNAQRTLENKISKNSLADSLDSTEYRRILDRIPCDSFNCWDFGIRASEHLGRDKIVSILCGDIFYFGRIQTIIKDSSGKIGDSVGWSRQFKAPWINVVIFDDLKKIHSLSSAKISEFDDLIQKEAVLLDERQHNFHFFKDYSKVEELLGFKMHEMISSRRNKQKTILRKSDSHHSAHEEKVLLEIEKALQTELNNLVEWLQSQPKGGKLTFEKK